MNGRLTVKLTVRALPAGQEVCVLFIDRKDQAETVAEALVRSEQFGNCCVLGVDWEGKCLFEVFPPPDEDDVPSGKPKLKLSRVGNVIAFPLRKR